MDFYSRILESRGKRVSAGRHYFDCQGVILCIFDPIADGDPQYVGPNPTPLYFETSRLEILFNLVQNEGSCLAHDAEILRRPWGERSFYVTDPFGNQLCFVERGTVFAGQFYVD